jgi:CheY-like chemotaxis protein/cytochrome c2
MNTEMNAILVVDDESAVRAVVESILVRAGYAVLSAKDGVEGLRIFKQHQRSIALLLSDVEMPNMNGLELADRVLELDSRMPVIFMSGNMHADRGWGCVAKPFTANELVSNIRQALAIRIPGRAEAETDSNGDGVLDVNNGDKVGVSCALCHTITDGSLFNLPNGGSVGHRLDGRANHNLNLGTVLATGANSRALYPVLQLALKAHHGKTLGRAPQGLTEKSTEAEVDAYLSNPKYYPVGMFDDTFDGNGYPMQISPLFRQDLAAPYGSEGTIARLDNFGNLVYTSLFDPTELTTPGGRAFLHKLAGAAGDEVADNYVKVLRDTDVRGYPSVKAAASSNPGSEDAPIGIRVDNGKLLDLNAYQVSLQAPPGKKGDDHAIARGRQIFRTAGCTTCHNVDQSKPVPSFIVAMKDVFPGDRPVVLAQRLPPLNPIEDTPGVFFDDKMAVVNASLRGGIRGIALPLLLDLARKPAFLHDKSVVGLDQLLDPARGAGVPHPFYLSEAKERADMVEFLRSLSTTMQ